MAKTDGRTMKLPKNFGSSPVFPCLSCFGSVRAGVRAGSEMETEIEEKRPSKTRNTQVGQLAINLPTT